MCGDDPNPDINKDDVSKDKGHALSDGITPTDGQDALKPVGKKPRLLEEFGTRSFEQVWPEVEHIQKDVAPTSVDEAWRTVGNQLHTSALNFETEVKRLKGAGGWEGQTIEAAFTNAINSISEPFYTGTAALRGAELTHKFRDVMNYVNKNLVNDPLGEYPNMWERYQFDLNNQEYYVETAPGQSDVSYEPTTAGEKAAIREYYNEYMRIVMNDSYKPGIEDIYGGYPQYAENTQPAQPITIPGLPEKPGKPTHKPTGDPSIGDGGGTPPGGGGFKKPNLGGKPSISKPPSLPEDLLKQTKLPGDTDKPGQSDNPAQNDQNRPSLTDPSKALDNGLTSGLTNAANQAMGAATQAATQAAKASPSGLSKGLGNKPKLPEGALQLGKGGTGPGAGGARGGGGGASLGGVSSRMPSLPAAATQTEAAGIARAGVGANTPPAMGTPGTPGGAGHGGGGQQQGKEHKVNKALRRRQNGTEIAGEAEAVVPVIGQDQGPDQGDDPQRDEVAAQRGQDRPRGPSSASPPMPVSPAGPERRQVGGRG